jgi:hypothetical protein
VLLVSLLPVVPVVALAVHLLASRDRRLVLGAALGGLLGVAPLLAFNLHYYGGTMTGAYSGWETARPHLDLPAMARALDFYAGTGGMSWLKYMPVAVLGFFGAPLWGARLGRLRFGVPAAVAGHLFFLSTLGTQGHCQYGPRYLMAALPLLALGLPPLLQHWRGSLVGTAFAFCVALYSLFVNLVGAIGGASYCYLSRFAVAEYLKSPSFGAGWAALHGVTLCAVGLGVLLFWSGSGWLARATPSQRRAGTGAVILAGFLLLVWSHWLARQEPRGRTWVAAPPPASLVSCRCMTGPRTRS